MHIDAMVEARGLNQALREEIEQRIKTQSRLAYLASHDPLTGLPNRTLLHDRLGREMDVARTPQLHFGIALSRS